MNFYSKLKYRIKKRWRELNDSPRLFPTNKAHQNAASIFRITLKNPSSELLFIPIVDKRIIKLERKGLYIKLERYNISIINHKYSYIIELPSGLYDKLSKMFDNKMNEDYNNEENKMMNQLEIGIENVLKSIINKK